MSRRFSPRPILVTGARTDGLLRCAGRHRSAPAIRGHTAVRPARGSAWFRVPQLSAVDYAAARGGRIVALTAVDSRHFRVNFNTGYILDSPPGRDKLMSSSREEKLAVLRDPAQRAELNRLAALSGTALQRAP